MRPSLRFLRGCVALLISWALLFSPFVHVGFAADENIFSYDGGTSEIFEGFSDASCDIIELTHYLGWQAIWRDHADSPSLQGYTDGITCDDSAGLKWMDGRLSIKTLDESGNLVENWSNGAIGWAMRNDSGMVVQIPEIMYYGALGDAQNDRIEVSYQIGNQISLLDIDDWTPMSSLTLTGQNGFVDATGLNLYLNPGETFMLRWEGAIQYGSYFSVDELHVYAYPEMSPEDVQVVDDSLEPVTGSAVYYAGDTVNIQVEYTNSVSVTGSSVVSPYKPYIDLNIGGVTRQAVYQSGNGLSASPMLFSYTLQSSDYDADGITFGSTIQMPSGIGMAVANHSGWSLGPVVLDAPPSIRVLNQITSVQLQDSASVTSYDRGDDITFTLEWSCAASVNTASGVPSLPFFVGTDERSATYTGLDAQNHAQFQYHVLASDLMSGSISLGESVVLNGGGISCGANPAALSLPIAAFTGPYQIDGRAKVKTVSASSGVLKAGDEVNAYVTYNQSNVSVDTSGGSPTLLLDIGGESRLMTFEGAITTIDPPNVSLAFSYSIQPGEVDSDGVRIRQYALNGAVIQSPVGVGVKEAAVDVTVDAGSLTIDGEAPAIVSATLPTGVFGAGALVDISVQWTEPVFVAGASTSTLAFHQGASAETASYVSGSGSDTLIFRYTVQAGDADEDGITLDSMTIPSGASIRDAAGNDAGVTLHGVGGIARLDTAMPIVTSVDVPENGSYGIGDSLRFVAHISEPIIVNGNSQLVLKIGSSTSYASYISDGDDAELVYSYTVLSGDLDADGIVVTELILNSGSLADAAGNDLELGLNDVSSTTQVYVDGVAPQISAVPAPASGVYTLGEEIVFNVPWTEPVSAAGQPVLTLNIGGETRNALYSGLNGEGTLQFRYTVRAGDLDMDGIAVTELSLAGGQIVDAAGNAAVLTLNNLESMANVRVDGVPPEIVQVATPAAGVYYLDDSLVFMVYWNDDVSVTGAPLLKLTIGSTTKWAEYISGSGSSALKFQYTITDAVHDTDGIALPGSIDLNGGTVLDGNGNSVDLNFDAADLTDVLVDGRLPAVLSFSPENDSLDVALDGVITIEFNQPVVASDGWFELSCDLSGVHAVTADWTDSSHVTLDPVNDFSGGEYCYADLNRSFIQNPAGVLPETDLVYTFLTHISTAPPVVEAPGNETGAPINLDSQFEITFPEPVVFSGNSGIKPARSMLLNPFSDVTWVELNCSISGSHEVVTEVSADELTYTITPIIPLERGETCTLKVYADRVHSRATGARVLAQNIEMTYEVAALRTIYFPLLLNKHSER